MNTEIEQFEVMSTEMLASIEGGNKISAGEAGTALGICTAGGAAVGAVFGSAPGANFVHQFGHFLERIDKKKELPL